MATAVKKETVRESVSKVAEKKPVAEAKPITKPSSVVSVGKATGKTAALAILPIGDVYPIKGFNPRSNLGLLDDMKTSLKHVGILEPLLVRIGKGGKYELIAGYRRFTAAKEIGLKEVPVAIRDVPDDLDALAIAITENSADIRTALSTMDEAHAFKKFQDEDPSLSFNAIGKRCGVTGQTVRKALSLIDAPKEIQDRLSEGMSKAAAIAFTELSSEVQKRVLPRLDEIPEDAVTASVIKQFANEAVRSDKSIGGALNRLQSTKKGSTPKTEVSIWRSRTDIREKMEELVAEVLNLETETGKDTQLALRGALAGMFFCAGEMDDVDISSKSFHRLLKQIEETLLVEDGEPAGSKV